MGDRRLVQRLSGGELLIHGDAARLLSELVEIAVRAKPDLWVGGDPVAQIRVQLIRDLAYLTPVSQDVSHVRSNETVGDDGRSSWVTAPHSTSVREAAEAMNITPRRVQQLLERGELDGDRDGPGCPWRVHLTSLHAYLDRRKTA